MGQKTKPAPLILISLMVFSVHLWAEPSDVLLATMGEPLWQDQFYLELSELEDYRSVIGFLEVLKEQDVDSKEPLIEHHLNLLEGEWAYQNLEWDLAIQQWELGAKNSQMKLVFYHRLAEVKLRLGLYEEALPHILIMESASDPRFTELGVILHGIYFFLTSQVELAKLWMDQYLLESQERLPGPVFLRIRSLLDQGDSSRSASRLLDSLYPGSLEAERQTFRPWILTSDFGEHGGDQGNHIEPVQNLAYVQLGAYTSMEFAQLEWNKFRSSGLDVRLGEKMVANRLYYVIFLRMSQEDWESFKDTNQGFLLSTPPKEVQPAPIE